MKCNFFTGQNFSNGRAWRNENRITFSRLHQFEFAGYDPPTWSIKYVMLGTEHYLLHGRKYSVSAGQFLLVNGKECTDTYVRSRKPVPGFCIHLRKDMMQDVYAQMQATDEKLLEGSAPLLQLPEFEPLVYSCHENSLGGLLQQLTLHFDCDTQTIAGFTQEETYRNLAHHMLLVQQPQQPSLQVVKSSTSRELLHRLELARTLIHDHKQDHLDVAAIASKDMLSPSHLMRSFKKAYGISTYQYLLQQRLHRAAQLLKNNHPVTDVALECGFSDGASFSKAFKKMHGVPPAGFRRGMVSGE